MPKIRIKSVTTKESIGSGNPGWSNRACSPDPVLRETGDFAQSSWVRAAGQHFGHRVGVQQAATRNGGSGSLAPAGPALVPRDWHEGVETSFVEAIARHVLFRAKKR